MEDSFASFNLQDFIRENLLILGISCLGIVLLLIGLIQFLGNKKSNEIEFQKGETTLGVSSSGSSGKILIDVEGEVQKPGVYSLDSSARIQDALIASGGVTADADSAYLAKSVNLAAPLRDGMKIYIPRVGEAVTSVSTIGGLTSQDSGGGSGSSSTIISINNGSQSELESLPGVGPVTANKIIAGRPYVSLEELMSKKAVGQSTFNKIKDLISL